VWRKKKWHTYNSRKESKTHARPKQHNQVARREKPTITPLIYFFYVPFSPLQNDIKGEKPTITPLIYFFYVQYYKRH